MHVNNLENINDKSNVFCNSKIIPQNRKLKINSKLKNGKALSSNMDFTINIEGKKINILFIFWTVLIHFLRELGHTSRCNSRRGEGGATVKNVLSPYLWYTIEFFRHPLSPSLSLSLLHKYQTLIDTSTSPHRKTKSICTTSLQEEADWRKF